MMIRAITGVRISDRMQVQGELVMQKVCAGALIRVITGVQISDVLAWRNHAGLGLGLGVQLWIAPSLSS